MRRKERIFGFVEAIWQWYAIAKRTLPWRDLALRNDTERAYRILVSEVMLQQTQVERVKVIYKQFLDKFETLEHLAGASNRDVILAWRGMGYNSRALRLRDAARYLVERLQVEGFTLHDRERMSETRNVQRAMCHFPRSMEELTSIPGIGHYTAAAVRNFAFNMSTPCIDTNIRRILHRTFVGPENADGTWEKDDRYLLEIAEEALDAALRGPQRDGSRRCAPHHDTLLAIPRDARNWHAALMDFGSLVQTKKNPQWEMCPLTRRGLMKTTKKGYESRVMSHGKQRNSKLNTRDSRPSEPGRRISGRFVPNRIIRGRVIETLRDTPAGLSLDALGKQVAADWSPAAHRIWLRKILKRLTHDALVAQRSGRFTLAD